MHKIVYKKYCRIASGSFVLSVVCEGVMVVLGVKIFPCVYRADCIQPI